MRPEAKIEVGACITGFITEINYCDLDDYISIKLSTAGDTPLIVKSPPVMVDVDELVILKKLSQQCPCGQPRHPGMEWEVVENDG